MERYIGEIKIVSFDFAPSGWATCDGQTLQIAQNQVLYSLIGNTYGGDGITTFALPNLSGRVPLHPGTGISLGGSGGEAEHTLISAEIPAHTHTVSASNVDPNAPLPTNNVWSAVTNGYANSSNINMNPAALGNTGGQAHENRQPYLAVNFVIALTGTFPSRD